MSLVKWTYHGILYFKVLDFICQNATLFGQKEAHNLALMMLTADQNTVGKG